MPIIRISGRVLISIIFSLLFVSTNAAEADWDLINQETLQRFQDMLRIDTSNPPGNETVLV